LEKKFFDGPEHFKDVDMRLVFGQLIAWYGRTQSPDAERDFATLQRFERSFLLAERSLISLIDNLAQAGAEKLVLTALQPVRIWKMGDVVSEDRLPPGEQLDLVRHRYRWWTGEDKPNPSEHYPRQMLHVGDGDREIATTGLAVALNNSAKLSQVETATGREVDTMDWQQIID
jgi:hypothetical protein